MKIILKPIFEMITGEYVMFENIIYNYIVMAIIGLIAFGVAWSCVGKLYDDGIIFGSTLGSLFHWIFRLIVFLIVFYILSLVIWLTKFVYTYRYIVISAIIILSIIAIAYKIIRSHSGVKK